MNDRSHSPHGKDQQVTFYTIGDTGYFPGVVGLHNSLRLMGHRGPLVVLDCGFTPRQRDLLKPHCTLVETPRHHVTNPQLFKPFPHLLSPAATAVIIDSDMIVTGTLDAIIAQAAEGKICAYPDPEYTRWFGEWQQLFDLRGDLRRQTYVNSGFLAFSTRHWPQLLERWWQACQCIASRPTSVQTALEGPFSQPDQDALNALLMSEVPAEALALRPIEEAPNSAWFRGVHVVDERTLACTYRGHATTLLHQSGHTKPWNQRAWIQVRRTVYVRLLQRLLCGPDVALQVAAAELPIWLRPSIPGQVAIRGLDSVNAPTFRRFAKWILPGWMVPHVKRQLGHGG